MLMLATVRIGAIHSVVFAGFGAQRARRPHRASGSRLVFTADVTYRKGKDVALKQIVDEALAAPGHSVEHVIVLEREGPAEAGRHVGGRDMTWEAFLAAAAGTRARTSRWRPTSRPSSSPPRAPPRSRSWPFTRTAATRSTSPAWGAGASVSSPRTCGGPRRTSAGSWATATWSMRRCSPAARRWPSRARSTTPHRTPTGAGRRGVRRHRHLHVADRGPLLMRYGERTLARRRSPPPRAHRLRRRGAQPAGVGVAPERRCSQDRAPGDRSHVADGNGRPGLWQSVRHRDAADQARLGGAAAARHRGGRRDARRPALRARTRRASW